MRKISSKFILVFILLFLSLVVSVLSALYATDVQEQHIVLTEVLGEYSQHIDKVTRASEFYLELKLYDNDVLMRRKDEINELYGYIEEVKIIHEHLKNLEYPLSDGSIIELEFSGEFLDGFVGAVHLGEALWLDVEDNLVNIINEDMVDQSDLDVIMDKGYRVNKAMIANSTELIDICREAADSSKKVSDIIQILALVIASCILVFVSVFSFKGIYKPIIYVKESFNKMSKGNLSHRFMRKQDDEFKELYSDFNQFLDALDVIFEIENDVVKENVLENILTLLNTKLKEFLNFESIGLVYKNYQGVCMELLVDSDHLDSRECEPKMFLNEITVQNETLYIPVNLGGNLLGYYFLTGFKDDLKEKQFVNLIKDKLNIAYYKNVLTKELLSIITETLADTAEAKDPETYNHLVRMSSYSQIISNRLLDKGLYIDEINPEFIDNIKITSPMHDIGKISIPDNILLKPGKLTDKEYEIMKTHAANGAAILSRLDEKMQYYGIKYFKMASIIALEHQEKYNGSGYPNGLQGDEISLVGRIVAIADVFDALTSKRPYKEAFSLEKSYGILEEGRHMHFDSEILDAFFEAKEEIEKIYNAYKEI